jgi:hypothetical protein
MLRHHVVLALRNFRRAPAAAGLNVFTLAVFAVGGQTWRAARPPPAGALRTE